MLVDRYGFHQDGNLVFLHEQGLSRCLTPGLETLPSPFELVRPDRLPCPHRLPRASASLVIDHPLIEVMAPTPSSGKAFFVPTSQLTAVNAMHAMTGAGQRSFAAWALRRPLEKLVPQLTITNAAPLVITGYEPRDYTMLERLLALPRSRTLVLCGPFRVLGATELPSFDNDVDQDWVAIGAAFIKRYVEQCLK